jgi:hypothetical protein
MADAAGKTAAETVEDLLEVVGNLEAQLGPGGLCRELNQEEAARLQFARVYRRELEDKLEAAVTAAAAARDGAITKAEANTRLSDAQRQTAVGAAAKNFSGVVKAAETTRERKATASAAEVAALEALESARAKTLGTLVATKESVATLKADIAKGNASSPAAGPGTEGGGVGHPGGGGGGQGPPGAGGPGQQMVIYDKDNPEARAPKRARTDAELEAIPLAVFYAGMDGTRGTRLPARILESLGDVALFRMIVKWAYNKRRDAKEASTDARGSLLLQVFFRKAAAKPKGTLKEQQLAAVEQEWDDGQPWMTSLQKDPEAFASHILLFMEQVRSAMSWVNEKLREQLTEAEHEAVVDVLTFLSTEHPAVVELLGMRYKDLVALSKKANKGQTELGAHMYAYQILAGQAGVTGAGAGEQMVVMAGAGLAAKGIGGGQGTGADPASAWLGPSCWTCGEGGHVAAECWQTGGWGADQRECWTCGLTGHTKANCPTRAGNGAADGGGAAGAIVQYVDNAGGAVAAGRGRGRGRERARGWRGRGNFGRGPQQ